MKFLNFIAFTIFAIVGGVFALVVYAKVEDKWHLLWTKSQVHYRLSFAFETPEGVRRGQTIVRVDYEDMPPWECIGPFPPSCGRRYLIGDAAGISFPDGQAVAMLIERPPLRRSNMRSDIRDIADDLLTSDLTIPFAVRMGQSSPNVRLIDGHSGGWVRGGADIPPEHMPAMILFKKASDPHTAHVFEASEAESWLGPGVKFLNARIDVVQGPIDSDIAQILPWLRNASAGDGKGPSEIAGSFPCAHRALTSKQDPFWLENKNIISIYFFCSRR